MPDQPELRQRLAEAIFQHSVCDCGEYADDFNEQCMHVAARLLALPDIAIVQLPEPTEDTDVGYIFSEGSVAGTVLAADYAVCHQGWEYTAEQARDVGAQWLGAAALLAAAGVAEEQTNA